MKFKHSIFTIPLGIGIILYYGACTSSTQSAENKNETEENVHSEELDDDEGDGRATGMTDNNEGRGHGNNDESAPSSDGNEMSWAFSKSDSNIFLKSFHFVMGSADDLEATVSGTSVTLKSNGNPTTFVFHNKIGNVGGEVSYMLHGFEGDIKLVHHFKDAQNYEFVSVNGNHMKLGRIVNGEEDIFDEKSFELETSGWTQLRVSAAGTHFKGYIGGETITHGHGDELDAGYMGMMINGTGSIMVKDLKATLLEEE